MGVGCAVGDIVVQGEQRPQFVAFVEHERGISEAVGVIVHVVAHEQECGVLCIGHKLIPFTLQLFSVSDDVHTVSVCPAKIMIIGGICKWGAVIWYMIFFVFGELFSFFCV